MTAPWCVNERWDIKPRWARVTGRERAPANLVRNPLWLMQNTFEEQVADWYQPTWPQWRRKLYWDYFRNPMQNARLFLWGWADRNYTVDVLEGNDDPMVVQRDDVGELGYQKVKLTLEDGKSCLFTSFCDDKVAWYYGTQPSGIYGAKYNWKRAAYD